MPSSKRKAAKKKAPQDLTLEGPPKKYHLPDLQFSAGVGFSQGQTEVFFKKAPPDQPHASVFAQWSLPRDVDAIADFLFADWEPNDPKNPKCTAGWRVGALFKEGGRRLKDEAHSHCFLTLDCDGISVEQLQTFHAYFKEKGCVVFERSSYNDGVKAGGMRRRFDLVFESDLTSEEYYHCANSVYLATGSIADKAGIEPHQPIYFKTKNPAPGAKDTKRIHNPDGRFWRVSDFEAFNRDLWVITPKGEKKARPPRPGSSRARAPQTHALTANDQCMVVGDEPSREAKRAFLSYINKIPQAVQGESGREQTKSVWTAGHDFGIPENWRAVLIEGSAWNERNTPPWSATELASTFHNFVCEQKFGWRMEKRAGFADVLPKRKAHKLKELMRSTVKEHLATSPSDVQVTIEPDTQQSVEARRLVEIEFEAFPNVKFSSHNIQYESPFDRADAWAANYEGGSAILVAPMGTGKSIFLKQAIIPRMTKDMPLCIVSPSVALSYQLAEEFEIPHYSEDPTQASSTTMMSLLKVEGKPFIVVDEARESLGQIYSKIANGNGIEILRKLQHAFLDGRLLLMAADLTVDVVSRFISGCKALAEELGVPFPKWTLIEDNAPILEKRGGRMTLQDARTHLVLEARKSEKPRHVVFCGSKTEANNLLALVAAEGSTGAVCSADTDRRISIDALLEDHDFVFATSAAASGVNIRREGVVTLVFDDNEEIAPRQVVQMIGRVRKGTEVHFASKDWSASYRYHMDEERLIAELTERARQTKAYSLVFDSVAGYKDRFRDPHYMSLWAQVTLEDNWEKNDRLFALETLFAEQGWEIDLSDPGNDGENPPEYKAAKSSAKEGMIDSIACADVELATDKKNIAGTLTQDQLLANRKKRIEEDHGIEIDPSDPVHRDIVWKDRDGKLKARAESAALAMLTFRGNPHVGLYDIRVKKIGPHQCVPEVIEGTPQAKLAAFRVDVFQALFGDAELVEGKSYVLPPDYIERVRGLWKRDDWQTLFAGRRRPTSDEGIARSMLNQLRGLGSVSTRKIRSGDRQIREYTFTFDGFLKNVNPDTVAKRLQAKHDALVGGAHRMPTLPWKIPEKRPPAAPGSFRFAGKRVPSSVLTEAVLH